jgi:hypothetical protein
MDVGHDIVTAFLLFIGGENELLGCEVLHNVRGVKVLSSVCVLFLDPSALSFPLSILLSLSLSFSFRSIGALSPAPAPEVEAEAETDTETAGPQTGIVIETGPGTEALPGNPRRRRRRIWSVCVRV